MKYKIYVDAKLDYKATAHVYIKYIQYVVKDVMWRVKYAFNQVKQIPLS